MNTGIMDTQKIDVWTSRLLTALALAAFVLSFAGMYAVAQDAGYSWLAWLWPLTTETAVVIFSIVYLAAKLHGYTNRWLMPLIIGCTALSVAFNVLHAPNAAHLTRAVVALPPLLLFAAFKTWIWKIELDTKRRATVTTLAALHAETEAARAGLDDLAGQRDTLTAEVDALIGKRDTLESDISELQREKRQLKRNAPAGTSDATRARAYAILAERPDISGSQLGRELGKSASLGRKLKREFEQETDNPGDSWDELIDALPMDAPGKDALHRIKERAANGNGVTA